MDIPLTLALYVCECACVQSRNMWLEQAVMNYKSKVFGNKWPNRKANGNLMQLLKIEIKEKENKTKGTQTLVRDK